MLFGSFILYAGVMYHSESENGIKAEARRPY